MAQKVSRALKDDDIFDELDKSNQILDKNNDNNEFIESIKSPTVINENKDEHLNNSGDKSNWKAIYSEKISKAMKKNISNKLIKEKNHKLSSQGLKIKKNFGNKVTGILSPTSGKVKVIVNQSSDEEDENNSDDEIDDEF